MRTRALILLSLSLVLAFRSAMFAQTLGPANPSHKSADGVYEIAASDLKKLDSSPKIEFPRGLSSYEVVDKVTVVLSISPEGKVSKAKAVAGTFEELKRILEKSLKKWAFQPYRVNGAPVPVRAELVFNFDNSFDGYRDPDGDSPVRLDENDSRAMIVKSVRARYPEDARIARIQGSVKLRAIIGKNGLLQGLHIITGHPMLAPAAYDAVRQWEFKPYVVNGKPLPVDTAISVSFALSGNPLRPN